MSKPSKIIHLPVAPQVTARTRFSSVMPSRLDFMMPEEALGMLENIMETQEDIVEMVAITGPGDPLAVPDTTIRTIEMVKERFPDIGIGLKTLGIGAERFSAPLARAGVDYCEIEVNGVRGEILEKLYAWIRPGLKTLKISEAVQLLLREQKNGVSALKYHNIEVSVVTTLYPGLNIDHVSQISRTMMELGADSIAPVSYVPEQGADVMLEATDSADLEQARLTAARYLPIREPKLGDLGSGKLCHNAEEEHLPKPTDDRPYVAVASTGGLDVDTHLGKAGSLLIYGPRADGVPCLLEQRLVPAPGEGKKRWQTLGNVLSDCFVVLAADAGANPRRELPAHGLRVIVTDQNIDGLVDVLYGGGKRRGRKN